VNRNSAFSQSALSELVDFSDIRYGQCWEDADILLEALDIRPGDVCVSIASAGDNTLAMIGRGPAEVIAIDLSPAQLACLELRIAAYRALEHHELLELVGSRASRRRAQLYERCRSQLASATRSFWDSRTDAIANGIGGSGKFERYLAAFRQRLLPLVHSRERINELLLSKSAEERREFYSRHWNNRRWRLLFSIFFSRFVMGRLGRDPRFFAHVEGSVADRIMARVWHGITVLDPALNPYLHWILTGHHGDALPYALRPENFDAIRDCLDHLELRCQSLEDFLACAHPASIDRFNLSDVFEYMPADACEELLAQVVKVSRRGARLAYWNLLVARRRPEKMAATIRSLASLSSRLHENDKTFFYADFVVEEVA
jgi:S-adenosylmethionine-diacylglycerol 3-amino-3-carboxypropyl transferase